MNCKDIERDIVDFIDEQLSASDMEQVKTHLDGCVSCQTIYNDTKRMMQAFEQTEIYQPSTSLEYRFLESLDEEKRLLNDDSKLVNLSANTGFNYKYAFQIAASFLLLFLGYFFGTYTTKQSAFEEIATLKEQTVELKENMMLAMLENRSASKRIQAVNYSETIVQPDTKITEALINRMQFDPNINVRLAAAEALSKFSELEVVKTAFIDALSTESDPNLQITIIQFLVDIQEKRAIAPMQNLLEQPDLPEYVKTQVNSGISQII